jgi:hypothetical protein
MNYFGPKSAAENQNQQIEAVRQWLTASTAPFFGHRLTATFLFGGQIRYLR